MALADTAKLAVQLSLTGNFAKQLGTASKSLDRFGAKVDHTESRAFRAGQQIGTGIQRGATLAAVGVGILAANVVQGLDSLVELEKQTAQTEAVLKSTGHAAGITAADVRALAEGFESLNATIGDEVIQSAENLLLGFTNIRKKAFKPALQAILDINTRLGKGPGGLAGTAQLVGRALQDPVKGLGRLERVIGPLDAKTKKQIANLVKQNRLYDAQALLLQEVEKRFGGAFTKEGGTTGAKVAKFKDAIEDLQRTLAAGLLPVVSNIADALSDLFKDPTVIAGVKKFGEDLAAFLSPERIKSGIGAIKDIFSTIAAVAGPAAAAVGAMVSAFSKLPPDLRNLLVGAFAVNKVTGGLVTNVAGGIIGALKNLVVPVMNVQAANVTVAGGGGVPGAAPTAAGKGGLSTSGKLFLVGEAVGLVEAVNAVRASVEASITKQATEIHGVQSAFLAGKPDAAAISRALAGVDAGIRQLNTDPIGMLLVGGPGLGELQAMRGELSAALTKLTGGAGSTDANPGKVLDDLVIPISKTTTAVSALHESVIPKVGETTTAVGTVKDAIDTRVAAAQGATELASRTNASGHTRTQGTVRSASYTNANIISGATRSSAGAIIAAIYAARPIINVTNVTRSTTIQQRYGPGNGSSGSDGLSTSTGH